MQITSAQAAKMLAKLRQERDRLARYESKASSFLAATTERVEDVRPDYDYETTKEALAELDRKIRVLKHAINVFNVTTVVPGTGMTVDELLVRLPQLGELKSKLTAMAAALPKEREKTYSASNFIHYRYVNYDVSTAQADLDAVTEELASAQLALDGVNHTLTFEVEI